ncbi:hypothetical protein MAC_08672 [Metarhizium acridum CQMa 102]|uniref:Uncharacterized protein n=1 Tax=Metarhizium acridum (strain CQMa 102) TaxID=655827 RepID=E9EFM5_METAQ|nr:uncharacterized protein MAC_08672 [Metarhizium acridum CQMa 102]EFY85263.1 hypothetical protein MAC_08672 [Metarhizium acridum CQMa 102]
MAANAGVRDGEFVKFKDWDLPGEDQAYLPNLKGNVSELKRNTLEKQGNLFLAFNTNGWIKSWAVLDYSKFERSTGSDLYVRVEYPGWYFVQGKDSPYNDIEQIKDVSTATALRETVIEKFSGENKIAAFNTDGWIKSAVKYPLSSISGGHSLSGIYIRLKFLDFNFYMGKDSNGNDVQETASYKDDIPQLIKKTEALSNSGGFNTDGWHKNKLLPPPPPDAPQLFPDPWQGIYYRTCWPDFIHLPGLDSPGNDIRNVGDKQLYELLEEARKDSRAVAANTDGWLKNTLIKDDPRDFPGAEILKGIYIKYIDPGTWSGSNVVERSGTLSDDQESLLGTAFFALKGTVIIWARWLLKDAGTRQEYSKAVAAATDDILKRISTGSLTPAAGAAEAHAMRNNFLIGMRNKTSPIGLLIARSIKPAGGQYDYYLNKNSKVRYNKDFKDLTEVEARQVSVDTISSAGRANPNVTALMRKVSFVSKGVFVVAAAVSVYSVATAPQWETELGKQVVSWSGAIAAGELGVGVGTLVGGPIGAILGGIAGSILGGLGSSALANWFFGGSSGKEAEALLGSAFEQASKLAEGKMVKAECKYYTHILRAKHTAEFALGHDAAVQEMVDEIPETSNLTSAAQEGGDEVLATIVWIFVDGRALPSNARNPKDMVSLLEYVKRNLP